MSSHEISSDSESETIVQESVAKSTKSCAWCKQYENLVPDKKYCHKCDEKKHKECSRCHMPCPAKFFELSERRCNACEKKYCREKQRRLDMKRKSETNSNDNNTKIKKRSLEKNKNIVIPNNENNPSEQTSIQPNIVGYIPIYNTHIENKQF